jgi:hypothetical protein
MDDESKNIKDTDYSQEPSVAAEEVRPKGQEYDEVFGEYKEGQVHYKSVGW